MKKILKNIKQNEKGFTLIELIVVIAIIGILAAVLLPKFSGFTDKARENAVRSEAKNVYTAYSAVLAEDATVVATTTESTDATDKKIAAYLGKLPIASGTTQISKFIKATAATADTPASIISYSTTVSGKTYNVSITEGGDITVKPGS